MIFAHRGASIHAPENTLAAFELAVNLGADGVELDAKLTADNHVIVFHDHVVDRTTDGSGDVSKLPLAALRELDAGVRFSEKFRGEKIPTLDEVFETVGKKTFINVELKNYATPLDALVPKVVEVVKRHGLEERILFSSFFPHNLARSARLLPKTPRGLLTMRGWMGWAGRTLGFRNKVYQALHPLRLDTSDDLVKRVHASGKLVNVWTVNSETDLQRMISYKVDGIITDDPVLALRLLGRGR
jgi:glycerophosphoryl diester phosphodiesterase